MARKELRMMDFHAWLTIADAFVLGFILQALVRWTPWAAVGISFLTVILLPALWGVGMTVGLWCCCAFLTFHPDEEHPEKKGGFKRILVYALLTFYGFILTLLILWKVKHGYGMITVSQREWLAWFYLAAIEVCFYKIIANASHKWNRFQIGYGIGFLNTCMLLFWLFPYGYSMIVLTLLTLLVLNPLLLLWVDRLKRETDGII